MNALTIDQTIEMVPAIGAVTPSGKTSNSYQFVSTRSILENVIKQEWSIVGASSQGRSIHAQHRVTLVHNRDLIAYQTQSESNESLDGLLRIELFNSHNLTKRFMMTLGYFRTVCSNGLIIASGPAETIRTKHRFSDNRMEAIMSQIEQISERFPKVLETINSFKQRVLSEDEQMSFAHYAIQGRYNYRKQLPKKFQKINDMSRLMLTPRRNEDKGNNSWEVYNRVQENIVRGIEGVTRPLRGYGDTIRVNQLLWKGAETTLKYDNNLLKTHLFSLLVKDGKKGKLFT